MLADVYSWMLGGFDRAVSQNIEFFQEHNIEPERSGVAIDLDDKLLKELKANSDNLASEIIQDDLINFEQYVDRAELIVCMTDTLLHLESKDKVSSLLRKVSLSLEEKGKFILTFRDLDSELSELNRFIPLKSDRPTILTCFLEYEPDTVKVHDLLYTLEGSNWKLNKSFYRKLRLSKQWIERQLENAGFSQIESEVNNGLVTIIASNQSS